MERSSMNLDTRKEIRKVLDDFIDWYECQLQPYKEIREDALTAIEKIMEKEKDESYEEGCKDTAELKEKNAKE